MGGENKGGGREKQLLNAEGAENKCIHKRRGKQADKHIEQYENHENCYEGSLYKERKEK